MQPLCIELAKAVERSTLEPLRDGDADPQSLSWESAVEEAGKWLGSLQLGRDLSGKTVDLTEQAKTLPFTGNFRRMVLEAIRRKLVKREGEGDHFAARVSGG